MDRLLFFSQPLKLLITTDRYCMPTYTNESDVDQWLVWWWIIGESEVKWLVGSLNVGMACSFHELMVSSSCWEPLRESQVAEEKWKEKVTSLASYAVDDKIPRIYRLPLEEANHVLLHLQMDNSTCISRNLTKNDQTLLIKEFIIHLNIVFIFTTGKIWTWYINCVVIIYMWSVLYLGQ